LIRSAIEFNDVCAGDILTPRVDICAISKGASINEIAKTFMEKANGSSPYVTGLSVQTPYTFVKDSQNIANNSYFRAINSRIQGIRYEVLAFTSMPPYNDSDLISALVDNKKDYRVAAQELCDAGYKDAEAEWKAYFKIQ